jgi:sugar phosphate isomerase/epimerase
MHLYKCAFSSNAFLKATLLDAVRAVASIGYEGIEILADRPHAWLMDMTDDAIEVLRDELMLMGIRVSNVNANTASGYYPDPPPERIFEPSLSNPDPKLRLWRLNYTRKAVDLAARLGCPNVSITTGRALPGCPPEKAEEHLIESLKDVLDYAEDKSVKVGVEVEAEHLVENTAQLVKLLEKVNAPHLGANFGVGHAWIAGDDLLESAAILGERLFHVHIEDIKDKHHYHLIPGEGDVPIAPLLAWLKEIHYAGFVTVDLNSCVNNPVGAAGRALMVLRKLIRVTAGR